MPRASTSVATRTSTLPSRKARERALALAPGCGRHGWTRSLDARLCLRRAAARVGAVLGAAEHDDALGALALEHARREAPFLRLERDGQHVLVDGVAPCRRYGRSRHERDRARRSSMPSTASSSSGRREQQRLARRRACLRRCVRTSGEEAHVEHAVGLVEHEHARPRPDCACPWLDEVDETAGRGHEDVGSRGARAAFCGLRSPRRRPRRSQRVPGAARDVQVHTSSICWASSRVGVTTSMSGAAGRVGGVGQGGSSVGSRNAAVLPVPVWAAARRSAALEGIRDGLSLDGGRLGVAELLHGSEDGLGKPEIAEGDALGGAGGIALGHEVRTLTSGPICGALLCKQLVYFSSAFLREFNLQKKLPNEPV